MAEGITIVNNEMQTLEIRLTSQAKNFATYVEAKTAIALKQKMATLRQTFSQTMIAFNPWTCLIQGIFLAIRMT